MEIEFEREILMLDRKTCAEARDAGPAVGAARATSPGGSSCPDCSTPDPGRPLANWGRTWLDARDVQDIPAGEVAADRRG